jgi:hypothetical protein
MLGIFKHDLKRCMRGTFVFEDPNNLVSTEVRPVILCCTFEGRYMRSFDGKVSS